MVVRAEVWVWPSVKLRNTKVIPCWNTGAPELVRIPTEMKTVSPIEVAEKSLMVLKFGVLERSAETGAECDVEDDETIWILLPPNQYTSATSVFRGARLTAIPEE